MVRESVKSVRYGKEKVYGGNDLPKSHVLSSEWKTERVREDASGDREDDDNDELPCVIGEREGDCISLTRLAKISGEFGITRFISVAR